MCTSQSGVRCCSSTNIHPHPLSIHAQILDIVSRTRQEGAPPDVVVQRLLDASRERWLAEEPVIDDTTIIVAFTNGGLPKAGDADSKE